MHRSMKSGWVVAFPFMAIVGMLFCFSTAMAQWENRGDLNLNGLPFELADAAIYANYFANGIVIFTIDTAAQIAATDINMDGMVLTVADYVMMVRIEMGAGDPPPADPDTFTTNVIYQYTDTGLTVLARFDRPPASMYLEYDFASPQAYDARLLQNDGSISMGTADAGLAVSMLITGMNGIPVGNYIPLVELAYEGDKPTSIKGVVLGAAGDQGNLFTDSTYRIGDANDDGKLNIGDAVFIIAWIFKGGPMPPHREAADANCDGAYNVGDAVFLVNFIFRSGTAPCDQAVGTLVSHTDCLLAQEEAGIGAKTGTQDCIDYQYDGQGTLLLTHRNSGLNCCIDNFAATVVANGGIVSIDETEIPGYCECLCLFDIGYQVINLPPGTYQIVVQEQSLNEEDLPLQFSADLVASPSGSFCVERDHYPW